MGRKKRPVLTELELEIMQWVWRQPDITVEQLQSELEKIGRTLALPSIRTMLGILMEKGYLTRAKQGRSHTYSAVVSAEEAQQGFLKDLVRRAFDNSTVGLVASLLDNHMIPKRDLKKVKQLIANYERNKHNDDSSSD